VGASLPFFMMLPEPTMLEIHRHYVLDGTGEPIAVQIPIDQFEALLTMLKDPDEVVLMTERRDFDDFFDELLDLPSEPGQPTLAEISGIVRDVRQELWAQS
jgi:hypothetical protein